MYSQTRPFRRAVKWAELLAQEFMCQGDLERKLGMPVQPMNDRDKMVLEDMQIGFIQFVATSLFESVSNVTQGKGKSLSFYRDKVDSSVLCVCEIHALLGIFIYYFIFYSRNDVYG